jgi:hypothetical protein
VTRAPSGALGVRWGTDAVLGAETLGLAGRAWLPWRGDPAFEACDDAGVRVDAFGAPARPRLIRWGQRVAGMQLEFAATACDEVRRQVAAAWGVDGPAPYRQWLRGQVVHLWTDATGCTLTLSGARWGRAFAADQLRQGLGGLAGGLQP